LQLPAGRFLFAGATGRRVSPDGKRIILPSAIENVHPAFFNGDARRNRLPDPIESGRTSLETGFLWVHGFLSS